MTIHEVDAFIQDYEEESKEIRDQVEEDSMEGKYQKVHSRVRAKLNLLKRMPSSP